jgi:hypothetical protein
MTGKVYRNHGCKIPIARTLLSLYIFTGDTAPRDGTSCKAVTDYEDGTPPIRMTGDSMMRRFARSTALPDIPPCIATQDPLLITTQQHHDLVGICPECHVLG